MASFPLNFTGRKSKAYTRFNTEWGTYEYNRCPQGFLNSTDAYNRRLISVLEKHKDMERCVYDIIIWANTKEEMFAETCSILKTLGDAGIVVNAEKLQYCKREVIFA